ncbi:MAG: peroxiredoxin [Pseudomonadota bacterium]
MSIALGAAAPDFSAETTQGPIRFHDWIDDAWCVLFSHPKDFTPVCTTELGAMAKLMPDFETRGVKVIGLSVDTLAAHATWIEDIAETQGARPSYPIIADTDLAVAKLYGMLPADAGSHAESRTALDNHTVRSVFVIAPDKTVKLSLTYPMSTGRSFVEILRVIDSLQLTAQHKVATPAGWRKGDRVIILPSVPDAEAQTRFPAGWDAPRPYLRIVEQPA